jgi:ubiquinone biosynthesis monooxygenase Coq7
MEPARLKRIRKGLQTLHAFEIMAVNIYKFALGREKTDVNRELTAAMVNEMTHV